MQLSKLFSGFLSPKIALKILRTRLEGQLKKSVPEYTLIYMADKNTLQFQIEGVMYPFAADELKEAVKKICTKQLKNTQQLDMVALIVKDDKAEAKMYFTQTSIKDGKPVFSKECLTHKL